MLSFSRASFVALSFAALAFTTSAFAQNYRAKWPSEAKLDAAIEDLKDSYGDVPLGINCKGPNGKAEIIICADPYLMKLAVLTSRAKFYAVENATRQRLNRRSKDVWSVPKECTTVECIYSSFKKQIEIAGSGPWNPFD